MPQPPPDPGPLALEEFRLLRQTIARRTTFRAGLVVAVLAGWALLVVAGRAWASTPLVALAALVVLAGGFEASCWLLAGVERIGRYLQIRYETPENGGPGWELAAARLAGVPAGPGRPADPTFAAAFGWAAAVNLLAGLAAVPRPSRLPAALVVLAVHGAFALRLWRARRFARDQRARDLEALGPRNPEA